MFSTISESQSWKSSLTFEKVKDLPFIQQAIHNAKVDILWGSKDFHILAYEM